MSVIHILGLAIAILLFPIVSSGGRKEIESMQFYFHLDGCETLHYRLKKIIAWTASLIYLSSYIAIIIDRYL